MDVVTSHPVCVLGHSGRRELRNTVLLLPHTLSRNLVHCVFSTKGRTSLIYEPEALWKRLGVIERAKDIALVTAGCRENHVHLLIALSPVMTLANTIQNLKSALFAMDER